jgi:hypothetical protein
MENLEKDGKLRKSKFREYKTNSPSDFAGIHRRCV